MIAAHNGPQDVSAILVVSKVWDLVEASTSGLAEAADLRVAYHLGCGDTHSAKIATKLCLFAGSVVAVVSSVLLHLYDDALVSLLTQNEELQEVLEQVLPLVGYGSLVLVFAKVASSLMSAQGRCREATIVSVLCSYCITLPAAQIMVYGFNVNLQAIVAAVVYGRTTFAAIMLHFMWWSNWERLSAQIRSKATLVVKEHSQMLPDIV
jgi:MATE family multidrug resistance protein